MAGGESGREMRVRLRVRVMINMVLMMMMMIRVRVRVWGRARVYNLGARNCRRRGRRTEEEGDLGTNEIDFVGEIKP